MFTITYNQNLRTDALNVIKSGAKFFTYYFKGVLNKRVTDDRNVKEDFDGKLDNLIDTVQNNFDQIIRTAFFDSIGALIIGTGGATFFGAFCVGSMIGAFFSSNPIWVFPVLINASLFTFFLSMFIISFSVFFLISLYILL